MKDYTGFLEPRFEAHRAMGQRFAPGAASPLTAEQLRPRRSLGYIR